MIYGKKNKRGLVLEQLEGRTVPATFMVLNLDDAGAGSFRQAMVDANALSGTDAIRFEVEGVLTLASDLPVITETVDIDALQTASYQPNFQVNAANNGGLVFGSGSVGSSLQGLSITGASRDGVTLYDSLIHLTYNYIGVALDGVTAQGNRGDGIRILPGSSNNTIGGDSSASQQASNVISGNAGNGIRIQGSTGNQIGLNRIGTDAMGVQAIGNGLDGVLVEDSTENLIGTGDPVTTVDFYNTSALPDVTVTAWQGLRGSATQGDYIIVGSSESNGLYFDGSLDLTSGTTAFINYPGVVSTSIYGPDLQDDGSLHLVGSYKNGTGVVNGFFMAGSLDQLQNQTGSYQTIFYEDSTYNYAHSTMGGLVVGNADGPEGDFPIGTGTAWLYDSSTGQFLENIVYPGSISNTAYGIWDNGDGFFTICGGYTSPDMVGHAYLVSYNSLTQVYSNWASFDHPVGPLGQNYITHFEGISCVEKGVFTLVADSIGVGQDGPAIGSWVSVRRATGGGYEQERWVDLQYPGTSIPLSSNSVYGTAMVGVYIAGGIAYQANIETDFTLSNVISGNGGNGIRLVNSTNNRIGMNYIGTDITGLVDLGNQGNGVVLEWGSSGNMVGGQATNGNSPTKGVFARPPQGNLISGNGKNGVLIQNQASFNVVSGNRIGTDDSGSAPLGNSLDGVAIIDADWNELLGCTDPQDPFVFYNVISGNGGNGVRVRNSDNITIHANFMGAGADNATVVPNGLNGLLVEGDSKNTQVGGVIPLGNVIAGNLLNGIEVRDTVSGFVSFNTFAGLFAFSSAAPNGGDGILITSTGGNNLLRTNVVSGNLGNGIHLSGDATGVTVDPNIVGLDTMGARIMANGQNGLLIDGNAHGNLIGGTYRSIMMQNTFSGNRKYGIAFGGKSYDNLVYSSVIGLDIISVYPVGNELGGIYLGPNTHNNNIGGTDPTLPNIISGNLGDGILIEYSDYNNLSYNEIGGSANDRVIPNQGNGVTIVNGTGNLVGGPGKGNTIEGNQGKGVALLSGIGNSILANSISGNLFGISLTDGANANQPAPVLAKAEALGAQGVKISGSISAKPFSNYVVELFANEVAGGIVHDRLVMYQGQTLIGSVNVLTDGSGVALFTYEDPDATLAGTVFTSTATELATGNTSAFSLPVVLDFGSIVAVGSGAGVSPLIQVYFAGTNELLTTIRPFSSQYLGGLNVAVGDLDGDGVPEIIAASGGGAQATIQAFDTRTGALVFSAYAFPGYSGSITVDSGDLNGDGKVEVIACSGAGSMATISVIDPETGLATDNFYAFGNGTTTGGTVAVGDTNGDGKAEIVAGSGAGNQGMVRIFHNTDLGWEVLAEFVAFANYNGGVNIGVGDMNGDGRADIIAGSAGEGIGTVAIFDGGSQGALKCFYAYGSTYMGSVSVACFDLNGPGKGGGIITGTGPNSGTISAAPVQESSSHVVQFRYSDLATLASYYAYPGSITNGISVAGTVTDILFSEGLIPTPV